MTIPVEPVQERCRETAGFLFSHPCRNPATGKCDRCGKPICAEHTRPEPGPPRVEPPPPGGWPAETGVVCIGCTRRIAVEQGRQQEFAGRQADPFFYAWSVFPDYHSYRATRPYSEADQAAFAAEETLESAEFEKDWGAS
mgnify:CR=1 FL=1